MLKKPEKIRLSGQYLTTSKPNIHLASKTLRNITERNKMIGGWQF